MDFVRAKVPQEMVDSIQAVRLVAACLEIRRHELLARMGVNEGQRPLLDLAPQKPPLQALNSAGKCAGKCANQLENRLTPT